jgi:hypothetical protein
MAEKWQKTKVNVTSCEVATQGTGKGGAYTLYKIKGTKENGELINFEMTSFSQLPLGLRDYEVQPYKKDGVVKNYTLRPPGGNASNSEALREDLNLLIERVDFLTSKCNSLEAAIDLLWTLVVSGPKTAVELGGRRGYRAVVSPLGRLHSAGLVENDGAGLWHATKAGRAKVALHGEA